MFFLKINHIKMILFSVSVLLIFFCLPVFVYSDGVLFQKDKNYSMERVELIYLVQTYKERIQDNKREIKQFILEKEWLENRVKRLEKLQVHVPWRVHHSLEIKQKKVDIAIDENKRLSVLLKKQLKKIKNFNISRDELESFEKIHSFGIHEGGMAESFKKELHQNIKKAGLCEWVEFVNDNDSFSIQNSLPIFFASGSAILAKEYKLFLKQLAQVITKYKVYIRINGYADVDSIHTKAYPSNFELGAARAANIIHELVKNGIKPSVFKIETTGRYRPSAKGMSNKKVFERRADIKVVFFL
ncbi:MAG: OmpA family protein [Thermodesulfobacteriota bacterium]|nr:OmpA family protein [Thermodesulfobacteriota bacterium]